MSKIAADRRFKAISEEQMDQILVQSTSDSVKIANKTWLKAFEQFLAENEMLPAASLDVHDIDGALAKFYSTLKRKDQTNCKNSTLKACRAALKRVLKDIKGIDIVADPKFVKSNDIFKGVAKINKAAGFGNVQSKATITETDMKKINFWFEEWFLSGNPTAEQLQKYVLFAILYQFIRRGRENLRCMKRDTFAVGFDENSQRRYIYQAMDEADKNHDETDLTIANQGRIYEKKGTF